MMRGTKPKPTVQKELEGNPGKRPINDSEPEPPELDATETPPAEVAESKRATAEWLRLYPMMRRIRMVTEADRSALMALCLEWARYLDATEKARAGMIVRTKTGYPMVNPYISIATKALAGCLKLWPELGLTPSSRSRLHADGPSPDGDEFSEFDDDPPTVTEH